MKTVKIRLRVVRMMTRTIVKLLMINNQLIQASMMSSGGIVNEQKRLYYQRNHYCSYCCARQQLLQAKKRRQRLIIATAFKRFIKNNLRTVNGITVLRAVNLPLLRRRTIRRHFGSIIVCQLLERQCIPAVLPTKSLMRDKELFIRGLLLSRYSKQ